MTNAFDPDAIRQLGNELLSKLGSPDHPPRERLEALSRFKHECLNVDRLTAAANDILKYRTMALSDPARFQKGLEELDRPWDRYQELVVDLKKRLGATGKFFEDMEALLMALINGSSKVDSGVVPNPKDWADIGNVVQEINDLLVDINARWVANGVIEGEEPRVVARGLVLEGGLMRPWEIRR